MNQERRQLFQGKNTFFVGADRKTEQNLYKMQDAQQMRNGRFVTISTIWNNSQKLVFTCNEMGGYGIIIL